MLRHLLRFWGHGLGWPAHGGFDAAADRSSKTLAWWFSDEEARMKQTAIFCVTLLVLGLATFTYTRAAQLEVSAELQDRLNHLRADLNEVKTELPYSCCINPACNSCAMVDGVCPCSQNVTTEVGVCGECLLGWKAGKGHAAGVNAEDVKGLSGDSLTAWYEKLAEHFAPHTHEH